eukprot:TRINITY_DN2758_c0_g1_i20.p1 TRINITY_DN2758_c0_g1~~TRINITY_DN2758_c0_g1_i20.p1  ORF type:complete len:110 (-),score=14.40 TRINITY_DN2758_c0_g1_i20:232-531(-)
MGVIQMELPEEPAVPNTITPAHKLCIIARINGPHMLSQDAIPLSGSFHGSLDVDALCVMHICATLSPDGGSVVNACGNEAITEGIKKAQRNAIIINRDT